MRWNSKEAAEDAAAMSDFKTRHTAQVVQASQFLQNAVGVEPGTRSVGGGCLAKAWEFPRKSQFWEEADEWALDIPRIIIESPDEVGGLGVAGLESSGYVSGASRMLVQGSSSPVSQGCGLEESSPTGTIIIEPPRGYGPTGTAPRDWQRPHLTAQVPHTEPPAVDLFPPLHPSARAASPPLARVDYNQLGNSAEHPVYWDPSLPEQIHDWFDDSNTRSTQSALTYLELRGEHGAPSRFLIQFLDKIKLIRMTISETTGQERDWFIIEVRYKSMDLGDGELDDPFDFLWTEPQNYWVMAFPVSAVTASHRVLMAPDGSGAVSTTWTLGQKFRVPVMYGCGVLMGFLGDFMIACASGKAVIEMRSV